MQDFSHHVRPVQNRYLRVLLLVLGWTSFIVGVIGIFVPILPTVPFVLLAAICWARASSRVFHWLMNHKYFGPPLQQWYLTRSLPKRVKIIAIATIFASMGLSIFFFVRIWWAAACMLTVGVLVSCYLWFRIPTRKN